jgi:membrane associated rhomboid family serine protease
VIVREVASLAHSHRVKQPFFVGAVPSILISPILSVAARAHVFGIMFSIYMGTFGNFHHLLVRYVRLFFQSLG